LDFTDISGSLCRGATAAGGTACGFAKGTRGAACCAVTEEVMSVRAATLKHVRLQNKIKL
jgi:hypothetical protein